MVCALLSVDAGAVAAWLGAHKATVRGSARVSVDKKDQKEACMVDLLNAPYGMDHA
jgi:hypothetical protein